MHFTVAQVLMVWARAIFYTSQCLHCTYRNIMRKTESRKTTLPPISASLWTSSDNELK